MAHICHNFTLDQNLKLKDAGAVTSTAVTQVNSADVTIDLGAAVYQRGVIVIDVTAADGTTGDEVCTVELQGAAASSFSTAYRLAARAFGDASLNGQPADTVAGRYVMYFDNVANVAAGQVANMQYLRLRTVCAGTTPSLTYAAWMVQLPA